MNKTIKHQDVQYESEIDYGIVEGGYSDYHQLLPLAGTNWDWKGDLISGNFDGIEDSSDFRLEFRPNGWFDFQADCRRGSGVYEIKGQRIALAVIKTDHATCSSGSRVDDFVSALEAARSFWLDEGKLYFELKREAKIMVFGHKP